MQADGRRQQAATRVVVTAVSHRRAPGDQLFEAITSAEVELIVERRTASCRTAGSTWRWSKGGDKLTLYVGGKPAATSSEFRAADYDLTFKHPMQIGFGRHDYFNGSLSDVRLYDRALTAAEVAGLARKR